MNTTITESESGASRSDGFTLIELLAAVSILALMLALLGQILATSLDGLERGTLRATRNSGARAALELIARELESAVVNDSFGFLKERYNVSGWPIDYDSLYFVTTAGTAEDGREYQQVVYKVNRDDIYVRNDEYYTTRLVRMERDFSEDPRITPAVPQGRVFSGQWWKPQDGVLGTANATQATGFDVDPIIEDVVRFDIYLYSGDPANFGENPTRAHPDPYEGNTFDSHDPARVRYPFDERKMVPYLDLYLQVTSPEVMRRVDTMRVAGAPAAEIEELLDRNSNVMYKRVYPRFQ